MKTKKFLLLFHFPENTPVARSPEETQAMYGSLESAPPQALRAREVA